MLLNYLVLTVFGVFIGIGVYGARLMRRPGRTRILGGVLLAQALLSVAALWALCTIPFGIGEPLIRVPLGAIVVETFGSMIMLGLAGGLVYAGTRLIARRLGGRLRSLVVFSGLLAFPLATGLSLYGLAYASLPDRERERDPALRQITLADGFDYNVYATGAMDNPTVIAFGPEGELYIGDIAGTLWIGRDLDADAEIDTLTPWADGFQLLVGLAWHEGELYAASSGKVEALRDSDADDRADQRRILVDGLPSMILMPHTNNKLAFGPDNRLYFGVGSTTSGENEPYELAASVLSMNADGSDLRVFARGFGNTFGIAFNSAGHLFGGDNSPGVDGRNPDELNFIVEDAHYGYPYVYGENEQSFGTEAPVVSFPAHSTPTGMTFYNGHAFPTEFHDNAIVSLWSRGELARIELAQTRSGSYLSRISTFGEGFLYPIDAVVGPDGNLYVADFGTSAVYRIVWAGDASS